MGGLALANGRVWLEGVQWDGHWNGHEWVQERGVLQFLALWSDKRDWTRFGHGGDEYGNCCLFFTCPLFAAVWYYSTGHYQTEVELPEAGTCAWADRFISGMHDEGD